MTTDAIRNRIATAMFTAWWFPFSRFGVIHGDPHLVAGQRVIPAPERAAGHVHGDERRAVRGRPPQPGERVRDFFSRVSNDGDGKAYRVNCPNADRHDAPIFGDSRIRFHA